MHLPRLVAVAAVSLCLPAAARAYTVEGRGWLSSSVTLEVDPSFVDFAPDALDALADAVEAWERAGAPRVSLAVSSTPLPRNPGDRRNVLFVEHDAWAWSPGLQAVTVTHRDLLARLPLSSDIALNAHDHAWGDGALDLRSTLVHELGHFLGLGHESHDHAAVMFQALDPGERRRTPGPDDEAGIRHLYANPWGPMDCASAAPADAALLAVLLLAVSSRAGRAHR